MLCNKVVIAAFVALVAQVTAAPVPGGSSSPSWGKSHPQSPPPPSNVEILSNDNVGIGNGAAILSGDGDPVFVIGGKKGSTTVENAQGNGGTGNVGNYNIQSKRTGGKVASTPHTMPAPPPSSFEYLSNDNVGIGNGAAIASGDGDIVFVKGGKGSTYVDNEQGNGGIGNVGNYNYQNKRTMKGKPAPPPPSSTFEYGSNDNIGIGSGSAIGSGDFDAVIVKGGKGWGSTELDNYQGNGGTGNVGNYNSKRTSSTPSPHKPAMGPPPPSNTEILSNDNVGILNGAALLSGDGDIVWVKGGKDTTVYNAQGNGGTGNVGNYNE